MAKSQKKPNHSDNEEEEEDLLDTISVTQELELVARWIPRAVSPWATFSSIVYAGVYGYSKDTYNKRRHFDELIVLFKKVYRLHGSLKELFRSFRKDDSKLADFIKVMSPHIRNARTQDTSSVKRAIISYLPVNPEVDVVTPPIMLRDKSMRGWNHVWTALYLCPLKDKAQFEKNRHAYMKKVQTGIIKLHAKDLPVFVYEDGTVYNPKNKSKGLFRSHVVIRTLRLIYTGESSAFTGHRAAAWKSHAELHQAREVTPEMIGYSCCQAYVGLSALPQWSTHDGYFDITSFYRIIVGLFSEPRTQWATETLEYLTSQMPSLKRRPNRKRGMPDDSDADDSDDEDPTGILAEQANQVDDDEQGDDWGLDFSTLAPQTRNTQSSPIHPQVPWPSVQQQRPSQSSPAQPHQPFQPHVYSMPRHPHPSSTLAQAQQLTQPLRPLTHIQAPMGPPPIPSPQSPRRPRTQKKTPPLPTRASIRQREALATRIANVQAALGEENESGSESDQGHDGCQNDKDKENMEVDSGNETNATQVKRPGKKTNGLASKKSKISY